MTFPRCVSASVKNCCVGVDRSRSQRMDSTRSIRLTSATGPGWHRNRHPAAIGTGRLPRDRSGSPSGRLPAVAALRLFPGISAHLVRTSLSPHCTGLVLEAYGAGNGPDRDHDLLYALREATDRGVVIVACTQCLRGMVHLGSYETGAARCPGGRDQRKRHDRGSALTKPTVLLGSDIDRDIVIKLMQQDLVGEPTAEFVPAA